MSALSALSAVWVANGHSAKAIDRLRQHITAHPDDAEGHFVLGSLYRRQQDPGNAEAEFKRTIQLAPAHLQARLLLGSVYQDQGRTSAAIEQFEAALKIEPRSAYLHAILGGMRLQTGEIDHARRHFEQGLAIDPNAAVIANNLAFTTAAARGNLDAALALAEKARELDPNLVNAADTLGWIQYKKGLYPGAIKSLRIAFGRPPTPQCTGTISGWRRLPGESGQKVARVSMPHYGSILAVTTRITLARYSPSNNPAESATSKNSYLLLRHTPSGSSLSTCPFRAVA